MDSVEWWVTTVEGVCCEAEWLGVVTSLFEAVALPLAAVWRESTLLMVGASFALDSIVWLVGTAEGACCAGTAAGWAC